MTGSVSRRSLLPEGSRLSSSRKRGLRFWRHRGFVFAETLIVLLIVSLGMAMAVPSLSDWQEERQLDLAAEELASAIREAETEARSETSRYGNVVARTYFFCAQDGDHVSYFTRKGTTTIRPKGSFPENIRGTGNLNLTLRKDGYAGESSKYSMYLRTKDGKYARQIVVAAYTGRVRIVRDA
jgi:Tfp pilus assembly protein FimT